MASPIGETSQMPDCSLCSKSFSELPADGICQDCRSANSLVPPSEPLRPRIPCARCGHARLIRCQVVRERATTAGEYGAEYVAPLAATFSHEIRRTFWANREVRTPDNSEPIGVFEAYVCRKCGLTELYARDAARIPIGPEYATEEFDVESGAPYR